MNDEVYVQCTSTGCRHCRLKRIMQRAPSVNRSTRKNPSPFQNSKCVAVHREHLPPEAIQKDAPRCFPREARKARQEAFSIGVVHATEHVERQLARHIPYFGQQTLNRSCLLPVQSAFAKYSCDLGRRRSLDRFPSGIRQAKLGPRRAETREVSLEAQDNVDRFIEWIILVPEFSLRRLVGVLKDFIDLGKTLARAAQQPRRSHLFEPGVMISSASPSTRSISSGGTEFPIISYALRRQTTFDGNVTRSGIPCSRAYSRTESDRFSS